MNICAYIHICIYMNVCINSISIFVDFAVSTQSTYKKKCYSLIH